jgi:tripartite-type tricarboxylate transporter receptor subunit TctC
MHTPLFLAAISLATALASSTGAQDFYAGKQLTVLVNYDVGGPTDIEARVFARHIGRHNGAMYRLIAMPPGAPQEAVTALRQAVARMSVDTAFIEEAQKMMGDAPEYVSNANLNTEVRNGLSIKPEIKAFMQDYVKRGGNR